MTEPNPLTLPPDARPLGRNSNDALRLLRGVFCFVSVAIAVACLVFAVDEWGRWRAIASAQIVFLVGVSLFSGLAALSVARGWRLGLWLAALSGASLLLYALAVVTMGWEDVGGASGAIPLALGTGLAGLLGVAVAVGMAFNRREAI
jgi:hypothetical protein